jgi:DNA polymerase III gamma/tau subunit
MVARLGAHDRASNSGGPLLDLPDQEIDDLRAQARDLSVETLVDYFDFMAAGDDEVARSPNPRFALEAVMVKLATLPKTLPVNELLERLEGLEKKLAGRPVAAAATPKDAPAPVRAAEHRANIAPAAPPGEASPSTSSRQPALAQPVVSGDKEEMWRQFVATVRREKRFLASHLDGAKVLDLAPGRLSIGVGERLELSSLLDTENFASLKNIAKRFFSEDIAIDVKLIVESSGEKEHAADSAAASSAAEKLSDMANETLRIFPGSSVRSVRREGGER